MINAILWQQRVSFCSVRSVCRAVHGTQINLNVSYQWRDPGKFLVVKFFGKAPKT
jgi:hypothetical protein